MVNALFVHPVLISDYITKSRKNQLESSIVISSCTYMLMAAIFVCMKSNGAKKEPQSRLDIVKCFPSENLPPY